MSGNETMRRIEDRELRRALTALLVLLYLPFLFANGYRLVREPAVDFPSFYFGAERAFRAHASPYGPDAFTADARRLDQKVFPYLYPPPSLIAFYPFTHWPYEQAKRIMLVLNHLALWAFVYLLFARLLRLNLRTPGGVATFAMLAAYVLLYQPLADTFGNGQINLIVVTLVLATWVGVREQRGDALVALPLAAAILLKTYPVLFVPLLWVLGRRRAAVGSVGLLALVTVAAYAVLPAVVWRDWFVHVLPSGGYGATPWGLFSPAVMHNQSLNGFLTRLLAPNTFTPTVLDHPGWIRPLGYSVVALILGSSYAVVARHKGERDTVIDYGFAAVLLAMFLIAPLSWPHHAVFVLPAAALLLQGIWRAPVPIAMVVVMAALALAWDLPLAYPSLHTHPALGVLLISSKFYAALVLWAISVGRLARLARFRVVPAPAAPLDA